MRVLLLPLLLKHREGAFCWAVMNERQAFEMDREQSPGEHAHFLHKLDDSANHRLCCVAVCKCKTIMNDMSIVTATCRLNNMNELPSPQE